MESMNSAFQPRNITELMAWAEMMAKATVIPKDLQGKPSNIAAIIAKGAELGIGAMQALTSLRLIQGTPTMSADLIVALVKSRRDVCEYFVIKETTPERAVVEVKRVCAPQAETFEFTIDEAKKAGLAGKDIWQKFPKDMLVARCSSRAARKVFQDLVMNLYTPEELEDTRDGKAQRVADQQYERVNLEEKPKPSGVAAAKAKAAQAAAFRLPPEAELPFGPAKGAQLGTLNADQLSEHIRLGEELLAKYPGAANAHVLRDEWLPTLRAELAARTGPA